MVGTRRCWSVHCDACGPFLDRGWVRDRAAPGFFVARATASGVCDRLVAGGVRVRTFVGELSPITCWV